MAEKKEENIGDTRDIIQELGGIRPLAKKLSLSPSTVQGWYERNNIPENSVGTVLELYEKQKEKGEIFAATLSNHEDDLQGDDDTINQTNNTSHQQSSPLMTNHYFILLVGLIALGAALLRPIYAPYLDRHLLAYFPQQLAQTTVSSADIIQDITKDITLLDTKLTQNTANNTIAIATIKQKITELQNSMKIMMEDTNYNISDKDLSLVKKNIQTLEQDIIRIENIVGAIKTPTESQREFNEDDIINQIRDEIDNKISNLQQNFDSHLKQQEMQINQKITQISSDNTAQALRSLREKFDEHLQLADHIITTAQLNMIIAQPQIMQRPLLAVKEKAKDDDLIALIDEALLLINRPLYPQDILHQQMEEIIRDIRALPLQNSNANFLTKLKASISQLITVQRNNYLDGDDPIALLVAFNEAENLEQLILASEFFAPYYQPMQEWIKDARFHIARHALTQKLTDYLNKTLKSSRFS